MQPNHLRLVSTSSPPVSFQVETKPRAGSDPEALWNAFVEAQERSKRTLALADGLAAGRAYGTFVRAFVEPGTGMRA